MTPEFDGVVRYDDEAAGVLGPDNQGGSVQTYAPGTQVLSPVTKSTFAQAMTYGLPGLGVGFADTVLQSTGFTDDNDVAQALQAISPGGFGDFYTNNQQALRAGGEMLGVFLPGGLALKALRSVKYAREVGKLGEVLKNSTAVDYVLGNSVKLAQQEARILQAAKDTRDVMGTYSGRTFANPTLNAAKRSYYSQRLFNTARETAAMEVGTRVLYNDSEIFYPADYTLSDEAKWAGIGLGIGVGIDYAASRYAVRNLVKAAGKLGDNAQEFQTFANDASKVVSRPGDRGVVTGYFGRLWELTNDAVERSANATLRTNAKQDTIVVENVLKKTLADMGNDTHTFFPKTTLSNEQLALGTDALKKNPNSFLFATSIRQLPEGDFAQEMSREFDLATKHFDEINFRFKHIDQGKRGSVTPDELASASKRVKDIEDAQSELHYVVENTGDFTPYNTRAARFLDAGSFSDLKRSTFKVMEVPTTGVQKEVTHSKLAWEKLSLDDRFVMEGPKDLSYNQWSAAYAMGSKLIREWRPLENQIFVVNDRMPRFQLEAIFELQKNNQEARNLLKFDDGLPPLDRNNKIDPLTNEPWDPAMPISARQARVLRAYPGLQQVPFGEEPLRGSIQDLRDLEFHIVDDKYKEFIKLMGRTERKGALKRDNLEPFEVIAQLNLPNPIGVSNHPLLEVFAQARMQNAKSLGEIFKKKSLTPQMDHPLDLLQRAMRDAANIVDNKVMFETSGNLLRQTDTKPLFVTSRAIPNLSRNDAQIHALVEAKQQQQLERLAEISPLNAPMVANVIRGIGINNAAVRVAKDVMAIHEHVAAGRGVLTAQDRIGDQLETIKAISLVAQESDRQILKHVGDLFNTSLSPQVAKLLEANNSHLLVDFNRVEQSYRHGWDVDRITDVDGAARFVLDNDSPINKELMARFFKRDLVEGGVNYMPDMSVTGRKAGLTPLAVSKDAATFARTVSDLSIQSGVENNALRVALGKNAIKLRSFHLPTPELSREGAWFVKNANDEVIATYSRGSAEQNKRRAEEASTKLQGLYNEPHTAVGLDTVKLSHMYDDEFVGIIDYSDQLAKTGSGITGGLASEEVDTTANTLKNMVRSLSQQFINVGVRGRAAIFEPQINYAKQASQMTGRTQFGEANVFDRYMAVIFSRSTQSPEGTIAKPYGVIEQKMDKLLSYVYSVKAEGSALTPAAAQGARNLRNLVMRSTPDEEFKQYKNKVTFSPFETTADWLESTHKEIPRQTSRAYAARLSQVSSTLSLRFLDVGTGLLNLSGVLTTTPAIITALRKLPSETEEAWLARTGSWGTKLKGGVMTMSPSKAMMNSIHAFWSGELNEPLARAAKLGYFEPEYAALAEVLTKPISGNRGLEKWVDTASWVADKSEVLSRKIAWGMGYKIGKELHGFDDERNAFMFATNFMNDMIGNYNPRNKPGMFQGALGLPLGAFQTYMFNFYRRMYGYLERKDWRTLAAAYATQASVFGAGSVPGWSAWNSMLFSNYDGSDRLSTRLDRTLPPGVSELVLHGSLSSIPAIFSGGNVGGIAFYPRGSVDITQVPANPTDFTRAAPIQFLSNTMQGITRTIENFMTEGGFSIQQQEEILANFTTNRALKSIMEMAANVKTDRAGQVVEYGTRDALHIAAALLGTVPSETRRIQDAYNAQQLVELNQASLRDKLNVKTRAILRSGADLDRLQDAVFGYVKSGGNPAYFGQWLRNNVETSFVSKSDKKLVELTSSGRWVEFLNMLSAMQQNTPSEQAPTP